MIVKGLPQIAYSSIKTRPVCLLSHPFLTRTLRSFACLPGGSLLVTVGNAMGRLSVPSRQPHWLVGQASPEPWARAQFPRRRETGTGARA